MPDDFEKTVAHFVAEHNLFDDAEGIVAAVSGGADSAALLEILAALSDKGLMNARVIVAHVNHRLRGADADADEAAVVTLARRYRLEAFVRRVDVPALAKSRKLSIETAARQGRLAALMKLATEHNCSAIATGHHKDDNTETMIQRLARGTAFRGLGGIWPRRQFDNGVTFVRPLLCVGRSQIEKYLNSKNLPWRTDHTNAEIDYRRNFIRHRLLPELQKDSDSDLAGKLFCLSAKARSYYKAGRQKAEDFWADAADIAKGQVRLDVAAFTKLAQPVKAELITMAMTALDTGLGDLRQEHFERTIMLADENIGGKSVQLPQGITAVRRHDKLIFSPAKTARTATRPTSSEPGRQARQIHIPGRTSFEAVTIEADMLDIDNSYLENFKRDKTADIEWFDYDKLKPPLIVRYRRAGDKFYPLGLSAEKKVGKFITDKKVPYELREKLRIIADADEILWLAPVRISEKAKVTNSTKTILQLKIT